MRVDTTSSARMTAPARRRLGTSSFSVESETIDSSEAAGTQQPEAAPRPMSLAALADPPPPPNTVPQPQPDHVAAGRGRALLGALAGLQMANLDGTGVVARHTLAELARALPAATDPGLDSILQAIAQRAAIELARSE